MNRDIGIVGAGYVGLPLAQELVDGRGISPSGNNNYAELDNPEVNKLIEAQLREARADLYGYVSELLAKCVSAHALDQQLRRLGSRGAHRRRCRRGQRRVGARGLELELVLDGIRRRGGRHRRRRHGPGPRRATG